ncbi:MAG: PrsW family glutamic-type intramembrane protease [Candidatus Thermoplasmatota archaeon]
MDPAAIWGTLAAVSFVPPLAFLVWARNHEKHGREPMRAVLGIFAHGGTLGIAVAITIGLVLDGTVTRGSLALAAIVVAPLVEELAKALGFGFVRRHVDELEDGLVYGVAVGLGFAATETFLYGLLELSDASLGSALAVVVTRNFSTLLLHAGSSALLGYGYARMRLRHGAWPDLVPFYLVAAALHALYNLLVLTATWVGFVAAVLMVVVVMSLLLRRVRQLDAAPGAA